MTRSSACLYVLIGLPGSGKTTYIKACFGVEHPGVLVFDDYQAHALCNRPDPRWSRNREVAVEALKRGQSVLVSDVSYCSDVALGRLLEQMQEDVPGVEVKCIYFENDPASAKHNVMLRCRAESSREAELIRKLSPSYRPPQDAMPIIRGTAASP